MQQAAFATILIICVFTIDVNCQWVVHNQTYVINTTVVQNPGYGPPPPGFRPNVTQFGPHGYNQSIVGRRLNNDLVLGSPGPYDVLLYKQWFTKPGKWLQVREKFITYPTNPWGPQSQRTITAIGIYDLTSTPGGHAAIVAGGLGHRSVNIRLFSDRGRGFSYKVVIYGR